MISLVVGDDSHDEGGTHLDGLFQLLDIGSNSRVVQDEELGGFDGHSQCGGNFLDLLNKLPGNFFIPKTSRIKNKLKREMGRNG